MGYRRTTEFLLTKSRVGECRERQAKMLGESNKSKGGGIRLTAIDD